MITGISSGYPDFVSYMTTPEIESYFSRIYADGFRKVRFQYAGAGSVTETATNAAIAAGLSVAMVVLANIGESQATYTSRCQTAVNTYLTRCFEWQLDNEPNIHGWSTVAAYVNTVRGAYAAIKAIQPSAVVQLGSIAQYGGGSTSDPAIAYPLNWLRGVYAVANDFFDEVAIHPYGYYTNKTGAEAFALNSAWAQMVGDADANTIRQIMIANGHSSKLISITEWGHPTWLSPWVFASYPSGLGMSEEAASDATVLTIADVKTRSYVRDFLVHSYLNRAPDQFSTTQEGYFGLYRDGWVAKPAAAVWISENPTLNATGEPPNSVTIAGNEITDAIRGAAPVASKRYDGLTSDSSFGIWKSSTNLYNNSGYLSTLGGVYVAASGAVTRDTGKKKIGSASAKFTPVAGTLGGLYFLQKDGTTRIPVSPNTQYTVSLWLMNDGTLGTLPKMFVEEYNNVNVYTGLGVNAGVFTGFAADGVWRRHSFTFTTAATTVSIVPVINSNGINWAANTNLFYVDGLQVEAGGLPSATIMTDGAAVTTGTPRVRIPTFFTATQGWAAFRIRAGWAATATTVIGRLFHWADADANANRIQLFFDQASDTWRASRGSGTQAISAAQTFAADDKQTLIIAWTATEVKVSVNGGAFVVAANATIPTLAATLADIGSGGTLRPDRVIDSDVLWSIFGSGTLTDGNAATIHGYGDTDPTFAGMAGLGAPDVIWPALTVSYEIDSASFLGLQGELASSTAWPTGGTLGSVLSSAPYGNTGFTRGSAPSTSRYLPGS